MSVLLVFFFIFCQCFKRLLRGKRNEKTLHYTIQNCTVFEARVLMVKLDGKLSHKHRLCISASESIAAVSLSLSLRLGLPNLPVCVSHKRFPVAAPGESRKE